MSEMKPKAGQPVAMSARRQNLILVLITLTQLVQMIPLGLGINSGLALGEALGASSVSSTWIVASYPLTSGTFVLIGGLCLFSFFIHAPTVSRKIADGCSRTLLLQAVV